jgi:hypothetical protein
MNSRAEQVGMQKPLDDRVSNHTEWMRTTHLLELIYQNYAPTIRQWASQFTSHRLMKVNVHDDAAPFLYWTNYVDIFPLAKVSRPLNHLMMIGKICIAIWKELKYLKTACVDSLCIRTQILRLKHFGITTVIKEPCQVSKDGIDW